jgi:hypothetical protein
MTAEFLPFETITETFEPLRGGQVRVRHVVFDNLLEKQKSSHSNVRSGEIGVQNYLKPQQWTIFKEGASNENGQTASCYQCRRTAVLFRRTARR